MKGKRILINAGMVTSQPSGVGVYSIELLKELIPLLENEGLDYAIYSYAPGLISRMNTDRVKKISLGFILDRLLRNKEVLHRHLWNIIYLNFLSISFDVVYSFTSHGTLFHRKQIITIHDLICLSFPNSHKFQYYYFRFFLPFLIKQSEHIISISNFTKNEVVKYYSLNSKKISVIYNGINHLENSNWSEEDERWLFDISHNMPYGLCVGASYPHKNIETLLEVLTRINNSDFKFFIINKPNAYYHSLQKRVTELQLKNVIFLPYVDASKLALLYKNARLNVYLSLYEGFGFPPAEAVFFRTQSLLSKQSALVEVYGDNFEYSDPFDLNKIEGVILKYVFSDKKIQNNSYCDLKKKYNWGHAAKKTFDILKAI
jgi:glycosyltransferase involved in cell wall biosynthesis